MCDNQTPSQTPKPDDMKLGIDAASEDTITVPAKSKTIKGTCAQFLRQNPRFINEPICHVLPNETSHSVGDCLQWKETVGVINGSIKKNPQSSMNHSLDSTSRSDYRPHPTNMIPAPLCKHPPVERTSGIAPLVNEPPATRSEVKELISFRHNYNSRTDPNEPVRGKLHGSFVWDPLKLPQQNTVKTLHSRQEQS